MRRFLPEKIVFLIAGILLAILLNSCQPALMAESESVGNAKIFAVPSELGTFPAKLPPLAYDYGALEKAIDTETMRLHHGEHHANYVKNLNDALQQYPHLQKISVEALLQDLNSIPENIRNKVRDNGGAHLNHTIFWRIMSPQGGGEPTGEIAQEINQTFGNFDIFKQLFNAAGAEHFDRGWVWLVRTPQNELQIMTTTNQNNPIMDGLYPIMGNDLWEHAYYLKYRNRRPEYLNNWWNVVNWSEINRRIKLSSLQTMVQQ